MPTLITLFGLRVLTLFKDFRRAPAGRVLGVTLSDIYLCDEITIVRGGDPNKLYQGRCLIHKRPSQRKDVRLKVEVWVNSFLYRWYREGSRGYRWPGLLGLLWRRPLWSGLLWCPWGSRVFPRGFWMYCRRRMSILQWRRPIAAGG